MQDLNHHHVLFTGFWRRLLAFVGDMLLLSVISTTLMAIFFGIEFITKYEGIAASEEIDWRIILIEQVVPAIWTISFWYLWKATPGKLLLDCQVVDADSYQRAGLGQLLLRYLCYLISALPLGLGFFWIAFSQRKQGWHDKLANTVVIMQDDSLQQLDSFS